MKIQPIDILAFSVIVLGITTIISVLIINSLENRISKIEQVLKIISPATK